MIGDILAILRLLAEKMPLSFWKAFVQPVLTVLVFFVAGFGLMSWREGSASAAIKELFINKHTPDQMQMELMQASIQDELIKGIMSDVLAKSVNAARIRLAVIHNGTVSLAGATMLRYDITHSIAREGFSSGSLHVNSPLSNWSYLADMRGRTCVNNGPDKWSSTERAILAEMGADYRLICPVIDPKGRLLGALYLTWQNGTAHPPADDIVSLSSVMMASGQQIAVALAIVGAQR